jgi:hypothetical protein
MIKLTPRMASVDSNESDQKINGESTIQQGGDKMKDLARIAILSGSGAAIGAIADRSADGSASLRGAGIGAGAGGAVGFATVLLTRGREVELRAGSTLDVVFDRPVYIQ